MTTRIVGAMPDPSFLYQQAAEIREQASHARRLAQTVTTEHDVAALTALANELERMASELERLAAELHDQAVRGQKVSADLTDAIDEARRHIDEIRRTIGDHEPQDG